MERLALGLADSGHDVLLVVGTDGEALARFRAAGVRCEFVAQRFTDKLKWIQYRASRQQLVKILQRERPDILHSNDLPTHQMSSDAARRLGVPRICHHRWLFEESAINWLNKFDADKHLFVSEALMKYLSERSERLKSSSRSVVYDGLPMPRCPDESDRVAARRQLELPIDKRIVLFAGQIIERKGVADLLQAWASVESQVGDRAILTIIGDDLENDGAYRSEMESLAKEFDIRARFYGFQRDVGRWLTAADIVMVPSHAEPLGNATLEAMSYARPVVGTKVGGIPEMIHHEETGLLVEPRAHQELAGAMERLIADHELQRRLGEHARRDCEQRFSLSVHVRNVVAQYESVLARQPSAVTP